VADGGEGTAGGRPTRPYRSPRREEQARLTRQRVLAAARDRFLASGWTGTTMRAVAGAAGVSVPTVELAFGTKAALLKACVDVAIAGDDEPVAVLDRPAAAAAAAAGTAREFLAAVAVLLTEGQQRSARLGLVVDEAAAADPALRPLAEQRLRERATTAAWITDQLLARAPLRPGADRAHAVDTVWLLMDPVVWCRLTGDRGWSAERYRDWFADGVARLLTDLP
jgi:AcrR family transcriptional regulator